MRGGGQFLIAHRLVARDVVVDHDFGRIAIDDRRIGELGLPRQADLANEQQVERRVQRACNLGRDRYATARQRQHDDIAIAIRIESPRQQPAGVFAGGHAHRKNS